MIVSLAHISSDGPLEFNIPVEVLAFRSDVAHAIVGFTLPLAAGSLFLSSSHISGLPIVFRQGARVQREWKGVVVARYLCKSNFEKKFGCWSLAPISRFSKSTSRDLH